MVSIARPAPGTAASELVLPLAFPVHALVFAVLAWALLPPEPSTAYQMQVYAAYCLFAPIATLAVLALLHVTEIGRQLVRRFGRSMQLVGMAIGPGLALWGLRGIDVVLYHGRPAPFSHERFAVGIAIGVGLIGIAAIIVRYCPVHWFASLSAIACSSAVAALLAVSLFDVYLVFDTLSYAPYLGPAEIVAHGGIPLVNAFSQYGPNFMLFQWLFLVVPRSLFSAAALVTSLNVCFYLTFLAIVGKMVRHKTIMLLVTTWTLLFLHAAYLYNPTRTPSVLAMRFLPPMLVLLAACWLGPNRSFSIASIGALVLTSLWSAEALVFGALVFGMFLVVDGIAQRASPVRVLGRLSVLATTLAAPHLVLSAGYLAALGYLPQYGIYLELVRGGGTLAAWTAVVDPRVYIWVLFGLAYSIGLTVALHHAVFSARPNCIRGRQAALLAGVCTLGIVTFSYFVSRSLSPLLVFLAWPLAIIVLVAVDAALASSPRQRTFVQWGTLTATCIALPLMAGVFADRFGRPLDTLDPMQPVMQSNSSALYALVNDPAAVFPASIWSRMQISEPFPPGAGTPSHPYWQAEVAYPMYERWRRTTEAEPLLILPEAFTIHFFTDTTSRIGLAHPPVDGLSLSLSERALARVDTLTTGDIVIVGNPKSWTENIPLHDQMLQRLRARCAFYVIERQINEVIDPPQSDRLAVEAYRLEC